MQAKHQPATSITKNQLIQNDKTKDLRPPPLRQSQTDPEKNHKDKTFPIPPQSQNKGNISSTIKKVPPKNGGELSLPFPKKAKSPSTLWKSITIFAIIFAIGSIIATIFIFVPNLVRSFSQNSKTADTVPGIPSQASLVMRYNLSSPTQRKDIQNIWDQVVDTPTLTTLLSGDPRLLMKDANLSDIYYVLLPNIAEPFLIVRQTEFTHDSLFSHSVPISVSEINDWYVAHVSDTDQYINALADTASAAYVSSMFTLPLQTPSDELVPFITITLNQDVLNQLGRDITSIETNSQLAKIITINAFLGDNRTIRMQSTLESSDATNGLANQQQLSFLPDDIISTYLGSNFKEDFEQQLGFKTAQRSLSSVSSLLQQLTGPYAYYQRQGENNYTDFGLIIAIPPSIQDKLILSSVAFEELLPSLLTLVLKNTPASPLDFQETAYQGVSLRYSNIPNSIHALDYAIIDDHIVVSTSKEGMRKAIQTHQGLSESALTSTSFTSLFNSWGSLPASNSIVIGQLLNQDILSILPVRPDTDNVKFGIVISQSAINNNTKLQGIMQIGPHEEK
jgi:hypothetical protein